MDKNYGNLQKIRDGRRTFAITPYIPGGFATPEMLEKIAHVARKYKGAIKITSGQRIMITNLREEDLNLIWDELGMEPAVRNNNSVKNVEMCPAGFCKRSKHNTIGLGMKLAKQFHGMDMPSRTKIGVSGCRNACGSVYSKDVGVVADVSGFIVTAGGSCGFYPRQSDIIAKELTEEQAYRLVAVILEYYKSEAEVGEKVGPFIDRIGLEVFRDVVLSELEK